MKIFVDMDGVLTDFVGQCEILFERKLNPWPEPGNYATDKLLGLTPTEFWGKIDSMKEVFWTGMRKTSEATQLLELCVRVAGKDNVAILTSPSQNPWCHYGKAMWIKNHFPSFQRNLLIGACKHMCAQQDSVLIDDYDENVAKFRGAGGSAILVPRPWNSSYMCANAVCDTVLTHFSALRKMR